MRTAWKYWVIAIALVVWWALDWLAGSWLNLGGHDLWILRGALMLIGLAAFATCVWWFKGVDEDRAARMAMEGAAGSDEIDNLMRRAQARLGSIPAGREGLGDLPVLLVLGEPGSAKTSIIFQCGLEPQLLAGNTVRNNTPIPTRALNLWYAPPFMVVEAGGPLLNEPPRWARMVKNLAHGATSLLGKGLAPPRLALVCIDCEKLLAPGAAATLGASIDQWRARLRETAEVLGINLPVYVLFTRADRLTFFQEYVAALSQEEASRVFGAALPVAAYAGDAYEEAEKTAVKAAFDRLYQSLADRRLTLLARQLDSRQAPLTYEFPREFKKLRPILTSMLVEICRPGAARTTPFLRGFYFTGVRPLLVTGPVSAQEEAASATLTDLNATRIFDVGNAAGAPPPATTGTRRIPQWVFLPKLFKEVLFQDSTALTTSTLSILSGARRRSLLAAAMGLLMVIMVGFTISSIRNKRLEDRGILAAQEVSETHLAKGQLPSLDSLTRLDHLRQVVEDLSNDQRYGPPLSMRWGLYVGDSLLPDLRRIYFQKFQELLFGQAQAGLRQTLASLPSSPGPNDRYDPAFDALKAYLLTTTDSARTDRAFLSPLLLAAWQGGRSIDQSSLQLAQRQFDFYAGELKFANPFPAGDDAQTIAHARQYLAQFPGDDRVYRMMIADADKIYPPLDFNRRFPGGVEAVSDQTEVSGAFTRDGWAFMQRVLASPAPYFNAEAWVMGQPGSLAPAELTKRAEALRQAYQRDYAARWVEFLRGALVTSPVSLGSASQEIQKLGQDPAPLFALFCVAAQNTAIGQADLTRAFQAVQSLEPGDCQDQPGPATAAYLKSLSELQACVDRADNSPSAQQDSAKAQCMVSVTAAQQAVEKLAEGLPPAPDAHSDQTVKDLLLAPINSAATLLRPGPVSAAGLCAQMSTLESQFPFNPQASREVSLQALGAVFAPTRGALSQFYTSALKNLLVTDGGRYAPNPAASQKVSPAFLSFFNLATGVQHALFPGDAGTLQLRYALRPVSRENVSSLKLSIDGQSLDYSGGSAPFTRLSWPGTYGQGVRLTVKLAGGAEWGFPTYNGMWGVFRFFADATVLRRNGNIYTLQWVLGGDHPVTAPNGRQVAVQFDLDTQGLLPIMEKGILSNLHCEETVAQ